MPDTNTYTYTLPSGAEIEIENFPERLRGAGDVSAKKKEINRLEKVIEPLGEISQLLFDKIKSSIAAPEEVSLEFGASLKGGTSLVLVSGETQATIKVTLTWRNKSLSTDL